MIIHRRLLGIMFTLVRIAIQILVKMSKYSIQEHIFVLKRKSSQRIFLKDLYVCPNKIEVVTPLTDARKRRRELRRRKACQKRKFRNEL